MILAIINVFNKSEKQNNAAEVNNEKGKTAGNTK